MNKQIVLRFCVLFVTACASDDPNVSLKDKEKVGQLRRYLKRTASEAACGDLSTKKLNPECRFSAAYCGDRYNLNARLDPSCRFSEAFCNLGGGLGRSDLSCRFSEIYCSTGNHWAEDTCHSSEVYCSKGNNWAESPDCAFGEEFCRRGVNRFKESCANGDPEALEFIDKAVLTEE